MKSAQTSVSKCIFCDNQGYYHCTECTSSFCQQCRTKHDKLPTTKTHFVTELKKIDSTAFSSFSRCASHKLEFMYFCTQCHILICGKCVTTEHRGHDITDIESVADSCRQRAQKNISELKEAVLNLSKAVAQMKENYEKSIKKKSESTMVEINQTAEKITKTVSFKTEIKLNEVENQVHIEKEEFQYDLAKMERIYKQQNTTCECLERLMTVSHDITFITSYEILKGDIHDISDICKERRQEQVYTFDKKVFVKEVVNAIVSDFEMR